MSVSSDPVNFVPAEFFFGGVKDFTKVQRAISVVSSDSTKKTDPLRFAAHVTLENENKVQSHCLVQFVTPQIWRIRYNPKFQAVTEYPDANSRIIVRDSFADLVDDLQDEFRHSTAWNSPDTTSDWSWKTNFEQIDAGHWILSTVESKSAGKAETFTNVRLHFFANPFRMVATRILQPYGDVSTEKIIRKIGLQPSEEIIWQTSVPAFQSQGNPTIGIINNVVMKMKRPRRAKYLGFGEQGGNTVLKKPTFMNYYCFDNFNYNKVYKLGPTNEREPLYHSTPFFLEMDGTPGQANVTGIMIDNYSQVLIDLGKTSPESVGLATRFNTFDAYILAADNAPKMIWQYSSMVGRSKLKPRYILGHHQGCYGYSTSQQVYDVVDGYRNSQIPLDAVHLDVDFQYKYRTFTSDSVHFPQVKSFFSNLRNQGVKCFTNITPILTLRQTDGDPSYDTLHAFWDMTSKNPPNNLLVTDHRYEDGQQNQYAPAMVYDQNVDGASGLPVAIYRDPNNLSQRIQYRDRFDDPDSSTYTDSYNFLENYNSGYPYHGGVSYGDKLGTPGYYPDLNREDARARWGEQYQSLFDAGLEAVWQDMTTPAVGNCYGDMLGFPSRLLVSDDAYHQTPGALTSKKTAIELWGLYSYNLHKATYHGLQKLKGRENKRNFIIGRGSLTGMHRFAGLWTGDNGSNWDFFRTGIAQVLSLGYSGMAIAGVDMGGFTFDPNSQLPPPRWCDPELLIRWYTGSFLLPWYRNHYIQHFESKEFQEPWMYTGVPQRHANIIPDNIKWIYGSVAEICKYWVQFRYSLMQVLYDSMFRNMTHGLPIARAMLITDPEDLSLLEEGTRFIDDQYLLGHYILVCPVTTQYASSRDVYLPSTDDWFPSNLRVNNQGFGPDPLLHAANLADSAPGGSIMSYFCPIPDVTAAGGLQQVSYVTPVYIRAGAIIPQIDVRFSINANDLNPPCIHVYPGSEETSYSMYLDDGVSRDSAPKDLPQYRSSEYPAQKVNGEVSEGQDKYRELLITQKYALVQRIISLRHAHDGYDPTPNIGSTYNVAVWSRKSAAPTDASVVKFTFFSEGGGNVDKCTATYDPTRGVLYAQIPTSIVSNKAVQFIVEGLSG